MEGSKTFKCDGKGDLNHLNRESKVELINYACAIGIFLCSLSVMSTDTYFFGLHSSIGGLDPTRHD